MRIEFLEEAREEFQAAAQFYEACQAGLGLKFKDEISHVCASILRDPLLWRERSAGYRRVNCPVFPYYVSYFIESEKIIVAAVAHGHRRPDYWKQRIKKSK